MIIQEYFYFVTSVLQCSALPAIDAAMIAMSIYVALRNKTPLSKWFGNSTSLLVCATLAALAAYSAVNYVTLLFSLAALLSSILSASTADRIWFQAFHLLGVYRALRGSADVSSRVVCALLHISLVLTNLDPSSKSLLKQVFQQCSYAQEQYLMKLHKLRQVTLDDMWPLPERYQLRNAYSEFKLNKDESHFVIRAIFRMMWRPMIPVYIVGMLLQFLPLLQIKLNSSIMHNVDDLSSYSMYMIVADVTRIMIVQLLDSQLSIAAKYIKYEMARVENVIDIEMLRLPLQRIGLIKKVNGYMPPSYYIKHLIALPKDMERLLNSLFSIAITVWMLYNHIGYCVMTAIVMPHLLKLFYLGIEYLIGSERKWRENGRSNSIRSDMQDITKGIKSIKIFACEKMFPRLSPKPTFMSSKKLPWYAPIMRLVWTLLNIFKPLIDKLSTFAAIYAYLSTSAMANEGMSNATILEIDSLIRNLQNNMYILNSSLSGMKRISRGNHEVESLLKSQYLNCLSHSVDTSEVGPLVEMSNCSFTWRTGSNAKNVLTDVSLSAGAGELVAIVGKTGSGKSSLLLAMCSEVEMTQGTGRLVGKISYLEQQPWIMNDTLRANILFGREYDEEYYWKVISACALTDDLKMWPNSDMTVIGENGMNISGGQRARLALARTVYSRADIYFLDDPLSAVDAIVKRHILDNIILSTGLLGNKLRFVTTHADNILPLCNQVVTVDDGHVSVKVQTPQIHTAFKVKAEPTRKSGDVDNVGNELQIASTSDGKQIKTNSDENTDPVTSDSDTKGTKPPKQWSHWSNTLYAIRICGMPIVSSGLMTILLGKVSEAVLDIYKLNVLKGNSNPSATNKDAVLTYTGATILNSVSSTLMWKLRSHVQATLINDRFEQKVGHHLIRGLLFAPLSYFESKQGSDIGREHINAIRTFTSTAYYHLSDGCGDAMSFFLLIYRIVKTSPWLLVCVPLFWWVSYMVDYIFKPLDKHLEDLYIKQAVDRNHNKILVDNGAQMIRLFDVEPYFTNSYIRSAESKTRLDTFRSTYRNLNALVLTAIETTLDSMLLYVYIAMSKLELCTIGAGDIAEFRQNCESISLRVKDIANLSTDTFRLLAKINEFRNLAERDAEVPYVIDDCRPSAQWPSSGKIEFRDFSMKYGSHLDYALKNINLTINPGEKIGIVGRTGAGKSSLAKVLFKLIHENTSGSILIDEQDISEFGVGDYRAQLGMIPQESTMMNGSIRYNLDPLNQFDVENMWASLVKCNMAKCVSQDRGSDVDQDDDLDADSEENRRKRWQEAGWLKRVLLFILMKAPKPEDTENLTKSSGLDRLVQGCFGGASSGQQQLFGLCRVVMRKRKVVVLDEATANVDLETDKSVQELIRKEFRDCSVLTIAHRLDTIMNSDRIVVMDKGTIAEIGTPQELLVKDGMFAQLVKTSEFGQ